MGDIIKPFSPSEVISNKHIPGFVIESVNELLCEKKGTSKSITILQKDIVERIKTKTSIDFDWSWMDFEDKYREFGWSVEYDKPGYCETYEPSFKFSPRR